MKQLANIFFTILLFSALPVRSHSQNCSGHIKENKVIGGVQILVSAPQTIVVRGTYTYSIDFRHESSRECSLKVALP
ncbi:MAG TPA: hypothetical protein ENJ95_11340 [Bacteroidetes bacterium]|nr:hypothetical protein [Bacteroidota bacterium]